MAVLTFFLCTAAASEQEPAKQTATGKGELFTLWPLFDYRTSPATGYRNLSILGPLFKSEQNGDTATTAIRPLFFSTTTDDKHDTDLLYPLASSSSSNDSSDSQVLKLYQKHVSHAGTSEEQQSSMLFPFYISGVSEKYGPYSSWFPFHGDIYERFWRDEYHYTLFPFYGRTVKKGTTTSNYLYPFFAITSGERESGFQFWPLYGQAAKQGVYRKRFVLWPFFSQETAGMDSDNRTESLNILPFYASSSSPQRSATYTPWPFTGVVRDGSGTVIERDFFWPFWMTATGKQSETRRFLPFYAESHLKDSHSRWVMWPLFRTETIDSTVFRQDKFSLLYFLFSHSDEAWPETGKQRARSALWPLYAWKKDDEGKRTLSVPALLEPVIWNDGVERNWAPLWRLFISTWDEQGNSATSLLWNLFWHERRGSESAGELSPLIQWHSSNQGGGFKLLKGLFGYQTEGEQSAITLFWLTFGGGRP